MDKNKQLAEAFTGLVEDAQSGALLLAMSNSLQTEELVKGIVKLKGYKCVVTEFGGNEDEFKRKIVSSVIGACLNKNIIEKTSTEIHAVIHATAEATKGFLMSMGMTANIALKIAIVRDEKWLSVALFGYSALHYSTNHKRACVGTMHIA